jgi:hypothetical protein
MPIESVPNLLGNFTLGVGFGVKIFAVLFVIFYIVFSLILFRQIQLMDRSLPSPIAPFLKFIGILQVGVGLAFLFVVIGAF